MGVLLAFHLEEQVGRLDGGLSLDISRESYVVPKCVRDTHA